jgi:hypothetical protein
VLVTDAMPKARAVQADLDVATLPLRATVLQRQSRPEEILLSDGAVHIRLLLRSGSVSQGPVRLRFALRGLVDLERQTMTLRQIVALARTGTLPDRLVDRPGKAQQLIILLRVHDALAEGATQRDIAQTLFGTDRMASGWKADSDHLRSRIRRMVRQQEEIVGGGYRRLLR